MMSIWYGIGQWRGNCRHEPADNWPRRSDDQLQWPLWGMHYLSLGNMARQRTFLKRLS